MDRSFLNQRLDELQISTQENIISQNQSGEPLRHFNPSHDGNDNIIIKYCHWENGGVMRQGLKGSRWQEKAHYTRLRLKKAFIGDDGKGIKYLTTKGAKIRPYFNGIYQYFTRTGKLDQITTLFITEGEFKAFAASKHNIPAVGISGIHNAVTTVKDEETEKTVDANLLPELVELIEQLPNLENIVLLFDADCRRPGEEPGERETSFYAAVKNFKMAAAKLKVNTNIYFAHLKDHLPTKGIDDLLVSKRGQEQEVKESILTLKNSKFFRFLNLDIVDNRDLRRHFYLEGRPDYKTQVNKYLSEKAGEITEYIRHNKKVNLKAPTGSGKSTLVITHLSRELPGKKVIIVPLTAIGHAIEAQYGFTCVDGSADRHDIQTALSNDVLVCTYDSFSKIADQFDHANTWYFIDESHYGINNYGWKSREKLKRVFDVIEQGPQVVLVSATPNQLLKSFGFNYLEVEAKERHNVNIYPIEYKGKITHDKSLIERIKQAKGKVIVRLCNKDQIQTLSERLQKKTKKEVGILTADTKNDDLYKHLTQKKFIPDHIDVLLVTSVIDCGVDIYNQDIELVISVDNDTQSKISTDDLIQFAARLRRQDVELYVYKKYLKQEHHFYYNMPGKFEELRKFAERQVEQFEYYKNIVNNEPESSPELEIKEPDYKKAAKSFYGLAERFCFYDKESGNYGVKHLAVLYEVKSKSDRYKSAAEFYSELATIENFNICQAKSIEIKKDADQVAAEKKLKEVKDQEVEKILQVIESKPQSSFNILYHKTSESELRDRIKRRLPVLITSRLSEDEVKIYQDHESLFAAPHCINIFKRYLSLIERDITNHAGIIKVLRENLSSRKFGDFLNEYGVLYGIEHYDQLNKIQQADVDRNIRVRENLSQFIGRAVTADEITTEVNRIMPRGQKLTKQKAVQLARILFEAEESVVWVNNKSERFTKLLKIKDLTALITIYNINNKISNAVRIPNSFPDHKPGPAVEVKKVIETSREAGVDEFLNNGGGSDWWKSEPGEVAPF